MDRKEIITINATFKCERGDANLIENVLNDRDWIVNKLVSFEVLPNTEHLKEDSHFQKLVKEARKAKSVKYDYINKKNK